MDTAIEKETKTEKEREINEHELPVQSIRALCPHCKTGQLLLNPEKKDIQCRTCGGSYPVVHGIIDLLYDSSVQQIPAAVPMEWGWMVQIYETRLWRSGPFNTIMMGISFEKEYNIIVEAMGITGNETVLDLACGPGMYARPLSKIVLNGIVIGLDLSWPMLNYTQFKAHTEGLSNLVLIHGSATDLPFLDHEFDVVNCCGALHLFPQVSTVQGIYRVLKPGGRFTVGTTNQLIPGWVGRKVYNYLHEHGWPKYFLTNELLSLFKQAGFTDITIHHAKRYWHIVSAVKPE
ncbi:MAG: methyltransferase domain-containing protein [Candidatus Methanofastidiosia archaeon]|jgi:ubiquinone/menaquinone biosynthesis C-methylase UbiE/uncharacterized protein YbaR (Trm112 family)